MRARDVMVSHPSVVPADASVARAARLMRDHRVGVLPVVDDLFRRRLVGIVTDRDLVCRGDCGEDPRSEPVRRRMTAGELVRVSGDADVADVMRLMIRSGIRRVPVVAEDGRVIGIVTLRDAMARPESRPQLHS